MRRLVSALAAVALVAAPTASAVAQSTAEAGETPAGRELPERNWDIGIVIAIVALAVLFAITLILDDDDEQSTSP